VLRSKLLIRLSNWLEQWLYRAADVVIVNSPGYVDHVYQRGARRVELVPNGVDCEAFTQPTTTGNLRNQVGNGAAFIVLYAGAHGLSNDLGTVLNAAELMKTRTDIHIVLVGAGKEKQNLLEDAHERDLSNVHFLDPVPKLQIPGLLSQADAGLAILMAIEAYKTTFPNKVFDYMAAALPVLCAIDGVIRDVVEAGNAGVYVEPGNPEALAEAILKLAEDRDWAQQMGKAGREWVARYDRRILATELARIMESTANQGDEEPSTRP
jgi:glycosyltransferase involved in cell wall biosynthesis